MRRLYHTYFGTHGTIVGMSFERWPKKKEGEERGRIRTILNTAMAAVVAGGVLSAEAHAALPPSTIDAGVGTIAPPDAMQGELAAGIKAVYTQLLDVVEEIGKWETTYTFTLLDPQYAEPIRQFDATLADHMRSFETDMRELDVLLPSLKENWDHVQIMLKNENTDTMLTLPALLKAMRPMLARTDQLIHDVNISVSKIMQDVRVREILAHSHEPLKNNKDH